MRKLMSLVVVITMASLCAIAQQKAAPRATDAKAAFALLKTLAGNWQGNTGPGGPPAKVSYRLTAGGTTLVETMFPGDEHEMVTVYYMDGSDLKATHYCVVGNQPMLKLNAQKSTSAELVFDFNGGTNMNPAVDTHMHSGSIKVLGPDSIESHWSGLSNGKPDGTKDLFLKRSK